MYRHFTDEDTAERYHGRYFEGRMYGRSSFYKKRESILQIIIQYRVYISLIF